jgi:hypothetical protein
LAAVVAVADHFAAASTYAAGFATVDNLEIASLFTTGLAAVVVFPIFFGLVTRKLPTSNPSSSELSTNQPSFCVPPFTFTFALFAFGTSFSYVSPLARAFVTFRRVVGGGKSGLDSRSITTGGIIAILVAIPGREIKHDQLTKILIKDARHAIRGGRGGATGRVGVEIWIMEVADASSRNKLCRRDVVAKVTR